MSEHYVPTYDLGDLIIDLGLEFSIEEGLSVVENDWDGFDVDAGMNRCVRLARDDTDLLVYAFDERRVLLGSVRLTGLMIVPDLVKDIVDRYIELLSEVGAW